MKISEQIKQEVQSLIQEIESKTTGEIVPVILKQSDSYPAAHFRLAVFFSLLFPLILYIAPLPIHDPIWFLAVQAIGCALGLLLAFHPKLKRLMLTRGEIAEEVHQRALEAFFHHGVHTTNDRDGVLIFISMLEQRAEILADIGIAAKVDSSEWTNILKHGLEHLKNNNMTEALLSTIRASGDLLIKNFPRSLENHASELDDGLRTE